MVDQEAYIQSLSEDQLRNIVLIPLLRALGLRDVIEYHGGTPEKGKDLIGYYEGPLGDRHYVGVVAKTGDIHGSVSKRGSAMEVLMQAEQALNEPYTDVYDLDAVTIDECWIIASGEIKNTAVESIRGKLAKTNLDKMVRFVDRRRLIQLIALHIPTFWYHERMALQFIHEMKAPLAGVLHIASFLRGRWEKLSPNERNRMLEDIDVEAKLAIHQLESFAMMLRGDQPISLRPVKLRDILFKAVSGLDPDVRRRIRVQPDSMMLRSLRADPSRLQHAIRCVIDNAIQYSGEAAAVAGGTGR
jgi:signal transduction histidine kinase